MNKDRKAALAALGAGVVALFYPASAKSLSANQRLTKLETAVAALKNRVAALETGTTPTTARYQLTGATTDRALNTNLYTCDELAAVLATLITDLGLKT